MPKPPYTHVLCIDPGASGAAALSELVSGNPCALHPFTTARNASLFVEECLDKHHLLPVLMENVHATPVMSRSSAFSFGTNFGVWQGILASWDLPLWLVTPQAWQHEARIGSEVQGPARKAALKAMAAALWPDRKITLATCDAALMGHVSACVWAHRGTLPGKEFTL